MKRVFKSGARAAGEGGEGEGRREAKTVEALEVLNELQSVKRANSSDGVLRTKLRLLCEAVRTAGKVEGRGEERTRERERSG